MLTQAARREQVIGVIGGIRHLIDKVEILIADQSARPAVEFIFLLHLIAARCDEILGEKRKDFSDGIATKQGIFPRSGTSH